MGTDSASVEKVSGAAPEILEYLYKPNIKQELGKSALCIILGVFCGWLGLESHTGSSGKGIVLSVVLVSIGVYTLLRLPAALLAKEEGIVRITRDEVILPTGYFQRRIVRIRAADIKHVSEPDGKGKASRTSRIFIRYLGGHATIYGNWLPDDDAARKVVNTLRRMAGQEVEDNGY